MIACRIYDMYSSNYRVPLEDNGLQIYAVLNLHENPRKLLSKDRRNFYCHFSLPLPKQVAIFAVGEWESKTSSISVEVSLDPEHPTKKIGHLTKEARAMCWDSDWGKSFTEKSIQLEDEDRMAKLVLSVDTTINEDKENIKTKKSPFSAIQNKKKGVQQTIKSCVFNKQDSETGRILTPKIENTTLDDLWSIDSQEYENSPQDVLGTPVAPPPLNEGRRKRTPKSATIPSGKRRKALNSSEFSKVETPKTSPKNDNLTPKASRSTSSTPGTPCSPYVKREVPSGRWGHAVCPIDNNHSVVIGGQGTKQQMVKDSLWLVSTKTGEAHWSQPASTASTGADRRMGHSVCFDPESKVIYVYGGSKNKRWFNDVHQLDTKTWTWSSVQTVGKAPTRAYHSCNLYRGELWVFGGVYPNPDPQPDGCSNEMLVMSLEAKNWYSPIISSLKPAPRSGHTACLVDSKLVMFGGWDAPTCYNDLFFFDLTLMEYTQPESTGVHPSPRSWHTAVVLPGNKMLIHGGYNGVKTLSDAFIFDLVSLTWSSIATPENLYARAGHSSLLVHKEKSRHSDIAIFGGGDNLGEFFNDFTIFSCA